jgi:hypothetical protein
MAICQLLVVGPAQARAVVQEPEISLAGQAPVDLARGIALAVVLVSAHPALADVRRNEICKTFSIFRGAEAALLAGVGHQLVQAVQVLGGAVLGWLAQG